MLEENNRVNGQIFRDDMDKFRDEEKSLTDIVYSSDLLDTLFGGIWKKILWIGGLIVTIAIIIFVNRLCRLNKSALVSAFALSSIPTHSEAAVINASLVTNGAKVFLLPSNHTCLNEFDIRQVITDTINSYLKHAMAGSIAMVVLMVICHYILKTHIHHAASRICSKLGYKPLIRNAQHQPGELKVMMGFLVHIPSTFTKHMLFHEVLFQLCTIPGSINAWRCEFDPNKPAFFPLYKNYRWQCDYKFPIKWGSLCLKSDQFLNVEMCQQLPQYIHLKSHEVMNSKQAIAPTCWLTLSAHSATKIYLEDETGVSMLYSFDMYPNVSTRRQ